MSDDCRDIEWEIVNQQQIIKETQENLRLMKVKLRTLKDEDLADYSLAQYGLELRPKDALWGTDELRDYLLERQDAENQSPSIYHNVKLYVGRYRTDEDTCPVHRDKSLKWGSWLEAVPIGIVAGCRRAWLDREDGGKE